MRTPSVASIILATPLLLPSCGAAETHEDANSTAPAIELQVDGSELHFAGPIDRRSADEIISAINSDSSLRTLMITSAGGQMPDALRIAEAVHDHQLDVAVRGYCISACAQYILPAGRYKRIEENSIVGFHGSPTMALRLFENVGHEGAAVFRQQSNATNEFYGRLGLSPEILIDAAIEMEPVCLVENPVLARSDPERYGVAWRYSALLLSPAQLEQLGFGDVMGATVALEDLPPLLNALGFNARFRPKVNYGLDFSAYQSVDIPDLGICGR